MPIGLCTAILGDVECKQQSSTNGLINVPINGCIAALGHAKCEQATAPVKKDDGALINVPINVCLAVLGSAHCQQKSDSGNGLINIPINLCLAVLGEAECHDGYPPSPPVVSPTAIATPTGVAPVEIPTETPVETPVETPAQPPVKTPAQPPVETPAQTPAESASETPYETPIETPVQTPETPAESPIETAQTPAETPCETAVETPVPTSEAPANVAPVFPGNVGIATPTYTRVPSTLVGRPSPIGAGPHATGSHAATSVGLIPHYTAPTPAGNTPHGPAGPDSKPTPSSIPFNAAGRATLSGVAVVFGAVCAAAMQI